MSVRQGAEESVASAGGMSRPRGRTVLLVLALAAAFAALAGAGYFALRPDPAIAEFQKAQAALRGVQSWRYKNELPYYADVAETRLHEVVCPDSQHIASRFHGPRMSEPVDKTSHFYSIHGKTLPPGDGAALPKEQDYLLNPQPICDRLARGEDVDPFPPFKKFLKSGRIRAGRTKTIEGVRCREWSIAFPFTQADENEDVCIGVEDHLPRFRKTSVDKFTYSEYNARIEIRPPR